MEIWKFERVSYVIFFLLRGGEKGGGGGGGRTGSKNKTKDHSHRFGKNRKPDFWQILVKIINLMEFELI